MSAFISIKHANLPSLELFPKMMMMMMIEMMIAVLLACSSLPNGGIVVGVW